MCMAVVTSLVVLFYWHATADILTLVHLGNSQVSVYRTIGPTLAILFLLLNIDCGYTLEPPQ